MAKRANPTREIQATWGGAPLEKMRHFLEHPTTERVLAGLITLNALVLGLETSTKLMAKYGWLLEPLDHILLGIFVVEVLVRLLVTGRGFFRDPWNVFDFVVITLSLMPQTGPLSVLRALRILRVLRLVSAVPTLRRVVGGLIGSMPGIGAIAFLLTLVYYCFAVMATNLFGPDFPEWFGNIAKSSYTLFTVMTLEGWNELANKVMEKHPYAWLFFIPYILTTTFTVLNLFIAIIVTAMQNEADKIREAEEREHREEQQALQSLKSKESVILEELQALRAEVRALSRKKKKKPAAR
ncbi:MAG: ion transporter [Xanthobacteraceae bacterium]